MNLDIELASSIAKQRSKRKSVDYNASKPLKIRIGSESDSEELTLTEISDDEYSTVQKKTANRRKQGPRGIAAFRAAVAARGAITSQKGWAIESQEENIRSGTPISFHAGGRFRSRLRGTRGRIRRSELLVSHRNIVEEIRLDEIERGVHVDESEDRTPIRIVPSLSKGIIPSCVHVLFLLKISNCFFS